MQSVRWTWLLLIGLSLAVAGPCGGMAQSPAIFAPDLNIRKPAPGRPEEPPPPKVTEKIIVNPIFFDYDKWDITPEAEAELDKVVYVMEKFPNVRIKIESHTDSRGKDAYNLTLSDNRAKSTQQYIIAQGIDASRIESAIGYGETRLVNKCKNGVKCSEEEHLKNRRSDFVIIEK